LGEPRLDALAEVVERRGDHQREDDEGDGDGLLAGGDDAWAAARPRMTMLNSPAWARRAGAAGDGGGGAGDPGGEADDARLDAMMAGRPMRMAGQAEMAVAMLSLRPTAVKKTAMNRSRMGRAARELVAEGGGGEEEAGEEAPSSGLKPT